MEINYFLGDLLFSGERMIAHGCNAKGVMGSGVAKAVRKYYPVCYEEYRQQAAGGLALGQVVFYQSDNIIIANCITQKNYGYDESQYVDYSAILQSLSTAAMFARTRSLFCIGVPLIGAGLGGGDWKKISILLRAVAVAYRIEFNVYILDVATYNKYAEASS